jgi:hypothetical protein
MGVVVRDLPRWRLTLRSVSLGCSRTASLRPLPSRRSNWSRVTQVRRCRRTRVPPDRSADLKVLLHNRVRCTIRCCHRDDARCSLGLVSPSWVSAEPNTRSSGEPWLSTRIFPKEERPKPGPRTESSARAEVTKGRGQSSTPPANAAIAHRETSSWFFLTNTLVPSSWCSVVAPGPAGTTEIDLAVPHSQDSDDLAVTGIPRWLSTAGTRRIDSASCGRTCRETFERAELVPAGASPPPVDSEGAIQDANPRICSDVAVPGAGTFRCSSILPTASLPKLGGRKPGF